MRCFLLSSCFTLLAVSCLVQRNVGAYYIARNLGSRNARHRMWLCPVTKFVFRIR